MPASECSSKITIVVPVRNGMKYLRQTAPTLIAAMRGTPRVELIYVDNGSTDGTIAYLESLAPLGVRLLHSDGKSIAAVRNFGARSSEGAFLSFVDADCLIPEDYCRVAREIMAQPGVAATGCETHAPDERHWIEAASHAMHYQGWDRDVHYINSANFFVSREVFEKLGGFREDLATGEDSEICHRILELGLRIRECTRLKAVHLGGPKSIGEYYRRTVWHGLGTFATASLTHLDKPTAMLALHLAATTAGVLECFLSTWPLSIRLLVLIALQLLAPGITVFYRAMQTRRLPHIGAALLLYWLYYWARLEAVVIMLTGRTATYRK